ncbi:hypothetical protein [Nonomuraea guangzhouensis]|uniref:Uncharacterized protein n=1 Tax=Nonomuraea guangzhouensis TaxID=1291555 RepID=A0ABW4G6X7_9ACTN|nr:hypothetical protein [Nonomuraea guangzhouensis]
MVVDEDFGLHVEACAYLARGGTGPEEYHLTPAGEKRLLVLQTTILPGGASAEEPYVLPGHVEFVLLLRSQPVKSEP